jgi:hypothetical protein
MNKELEKRLEEYFLAWREDMNEIDNKFLKGLIPYTQHQSTLLEVQRLWADRMFDAIHSGSDW